MSTRPHDISSETDTLDAYFPEVEKEFIRRHAYPYFDWVSFDVPSRLNPLRTPVSRARVGMVTTCGAHLKTDPPFKLMSRVGDPTFREIPNTADLDDVVLSHVGYNTQRVSADKNCVFPLDRLRELEAEGLIDELAPRHFSFMGYVAFTAPLIHEIAPMVVRQLKADQVDLVLLAPA